MGNGELGSSLIIGPASRFAGNSVGTAVATGRKVFRLVRRVRLRKRTAGDEPQPSLEAPAFELEGERKERDRIAVLESSLTEAQREVANAHDEAQEVQSRLEWQLSALRTKKEAVIQDRTEEEGGAAITPAEAAIEAPWEAIAGRQGEVPEVAAARYGVEEPQPQTIEPEASVLPDVTVQEVRDASFASTAARARFEKALSDFADRRVAVRAAAATAMGDISHELSVRALSGQLLRESSPQVREKCVVALVALGMKGGLPAVERALADPAASVRLPAVRAVYHLGGAEAARSLPRMLSDENEDVRRRAVTYVGWLDQEDLALKLLLPLNDSSVSVRRAAAEAAKNLRSPLMISVLIKRLNDPDESVRKAVLSAIEAITGEKKSAGLPADEGARQRLIGRWRRWWRKEDARKAVLKRSRRRGMHILREEAI